MQEIAISEMLNEISESRAQNPAFGDWRWTSTPIFNAESDKGNSVANGLSLNGNANAPGVSERLDVLHGWVVNIKTGAARKDFDKRTQIPVQFVCPSP